MVKRLMTHYSLYAKLNSTMLSPDIVAELDDWRGFLTNNSAFIDPFDFVKDMAVEDPGDSPIISARFGKVGKIRENATDFLPFFGTDIGFCSLVKPQLSFDPHLAHLPFSKKLFGPKGDNNSYSRRIKPGAKVGKENGLRLLLDAEIFDYTYHRHVSEGFKIAVEHHLNQPLMSMNEIDITPGFETQIAITPVLYKTTNAARTRFTPVERGCYFEDELKLNYLPTELYRYDISNCLFEATYEKVLEVCQCTPYFHWAGVRKHRQFCRGPSLVCQNEIFSKIGEYTQVEEAGMSDTSDGGESAHSSPPKTQPCLAACEDQQNNVAMSSSRIPNRETLVEWPDFCLVVRKLYRVCNKPWKRSDLEANYPDLCSLLLSSVESEFGSTPSSEFRTDKGCKKLFTFGLSLQSETSASEPSLEMAGNATSISGNQMILLDSIFRYSRDNLALVNIYIKPPVVTRILRDQRIPIIWFVANCGGILGLCMGFSIVTVFEVLHFVLQTICPSVFGRAKRLKTGRTSGGHGGSRKTKSGGNGGNTVTTDDSQMRQSYHDLGNNSL